jgi:hypothetical protein
VEITENCEEFAASQKTNFLYFIGDHLLLLLIIKAVEASFTWPPYSEKDNRANLLDGEQNAIVVNFNLMKDSMKILHIIE